MDLIHKKSIDLQLTPFNSGKKFNSYEWDAFMLDEEVMDCNNCNDIATMKAFIIDGRGNRKCPKCNRIIFDV